MSRSPLDTTAVVETPERVRFRYRVAGPGRRFVAWLVDFAVRMVIIIVCSVLVMVASIVSPEFFGTVGTGLMLVVMFVLEWFYGTLFEALWSGRTPGKFVLGIRVVRRNGAPVQFRDCLLRNFMRCVDFLPAISVPGTILWIPTFAVSMVAMLMDKRMRRIGDWVGGTVVVVDEKTRVFGEVQLSSPITDDERSQLPVSVRLSRNELQVIEGLLRRSDSLSKGRTEELAGMLSPILQDREGVESDTALRSVELAYARAARKDR